MAKYCLVFNTNQEFESALQDETSTLYTMMRDVTTEQPSVAVSCYIKETAETEICGTNIMYRGLFFASHGDQVSYNNNLKDWFTIKKSKYLLIKTNVLSGFDDFYVVNTNDGSKIQVMKEVYNSRVLSPHGSTETIKDYVIPGKIEKNVDKTTGNGFNDVYVCFDGIDMTIEDEWQNCVKLHQNVNFNIAGTEVEIDPYNYNNSYDVFLKKMLSPTFDYTKKDSITESGWYTTRELRKWNPVADGTGFLCEIGEYMNKDYYIPNIVDLCNMYDLIRHLDDCGFISCSVADNGTSMYGIMNGKIVTCGIRSYVDFVLVRDIHY